MLLVKGIAKGRGLPIRHITWGSSQIRVMAAFKATTFFRLL
jgi:hypothetical protein